MRRGARLASVTRLLAVVPQILAANHNRPLARRVHRELNHMAAQAADLDVQNAARRASQVIEVVYNVIIGNADAGQLLTNTVMNPGSRLAMLEAFNRVGVYARADPFQGFGCAPGQYFRATIVQPRTGAVVPNPDGQSRACSMEGLGSERELTEDSATFVCRVDHRGTDLRRGA